MWRFRTLSFASRAFAHVPSPCLLKRPFLGYSLHLDVSRSNAQRLLFLEGERFVSERALVGGLVKKADTVVDVGANIGYYALLFKHYIGDNGRIIAFEPEPDNLAELRLNVDRSRFRNIEIHPCAVGARGGTAVFARGINGGVMRGGSPAAAVADEVRMVALDEILKDPVHVIKIDVEGFEGEVLSGARRSIERWRPSLFLEIHPALLPANHTVDGIFEFLQRYYANITLYQPARNQSLARKVMSRYFGAGVIEVLPSLDAVASLCARGQQETFWAVCRPSAVTGTRTTL